MGDILFQSEVIRRQCGSCPKSGPNFHVLAPKIVRGGPANFWCSFWNDTHFLTCGKVWWQSVEGLPRLRAGKEETRERALGKVQTHADLDIFWPQILCHCKITFIVAPSGECLLVVAAVATSQLLTVWPCHLTFWPQIKWVTRTCHVLSTCQV